MRTIFLAIFLLVGAQSFSQALSPQQYCEALESKTKNSYEVLNLDSGIPSMTPTTQTQTVTSSGNQAGSFMAEFEACSQKYTAVAAIIEDGSDNQVIAPSTIKFSLVQAGTNYDLCPGTKLPYAFPNQKLSEVGSGCYTAKGIKFRNGNLCSLDSWSLSPITKKNGEGKTEVTGISVTFEYTKVNVTSVMTVKYCSKGYFTVASARAGPLSQKYDSVISCVKAQGSSSSNEFVEVKPVQGEIMENLKKWLVDQGGCR